MDDLHRNTNPGAGAPDAAASRDDLRANEMRANEMRANAERADDLRRDDLNAGDEIGEAVGGISGVLTGAALGSLGGPVGTIIGGIAGAVSGWWAGRAISEAASHVTSDDEDYYRTHYEGSGSTLADRSYDDVRPAYQIGHLASRNPDYSERGFDDVEGDLRRGWSDDVSARHGQWDSVRDYARHAYERGRGGFGTGAVAGSADTSAREFDRVSDSPASGAGYGASAGGPTGRAGATSRPDHTTGGSSLGGPAHDTSASHGGTSRADTSRADTSRGGESLASSSLVGPPPRDALGANAREEYATDRTSPRLDDSIARAGGGDSDATSADGDSTSRLDDLKDRMDGNPRSRPGPDATDRRF